MESGQEASLSISCDSSPKRVSCELRKMFNGNISRFVRRKWNASVSGRRISHRDVEQEEFQYASNHCLSSYYSVFVVRLAIMVMLAILIGMLTILTWHFTKIYTKKSLNTLASGLRYELLQRPILRMWNILNSTSEITTAQVKLSEYVFRKFNKLSTQAELVELYDAMKDVTWAMFASRKALNAITIKYRNGFVQAFHRDHRSNQTFYIYSDLVNYSISAAVPQDISMSMHREWNDESIHGNISAIWYREPLDPSTGQKIGKSLPILPDDLINIAGISQVPDGAASWHVAVSKYTDSPLLSAALPVFDAGEESSSIVAVVGVTTALHSVGELMRELAEVHGGHIYLTLPKGYLLATSTNAPLLMHTPKGPELMRAIDSNEWVIRRGAQWLEKTFGDNLPSGHAVHVDNAKFGDQPYYIDSFFLNVTRLPIVGVVIIPRKFIMGKVDERAFKTLIILISASLCILFIGCVCILILTNGVSKEMKLRAELIRQLDARRRAEASSNCKSQFLANMSHDLRTPMAAVIGLLDILIGDDCLTNEQYATVTQIRKCSTALLRLLNNILDLSKVESGKLVLEEAEFDLGRELEGLVDMFSVQRINHNVETVLDLSDDMPDLVRGDSARVVQIFANLISNSIKFTTTGHIVLRGWCETLNSPADQKASRVTIKSKFIQHRNHSKNSCKNESKMILWFEVDDAGTGIDPSKWDSVFESFEQADPSTTRTHGGTGLGLCIVRTLVNKMGGEIKVVKKNGPGTLMRLYMIFSTPADIGQQLYEVDYSKHNLMVVLALYGSMGRMIMSKWLRKHGVSTMEASDWNELTHILRYLFQTRNQDSGFNSQSMIAEQFKSELSNMQEIKNLCFVIVLDIGILDLSTDIWKEQLNYLDRFSGKAKFAWMLNPDTTNTLKMELRRKGHVLIVNKPLYKAKMIQILEAVLKDRDTKVQKRSSTADTSCECVEIESIQYDALSSDESENKEDGKLSCSSKNLNEQKQKCLEGLRILLAEDTPVLQRVATMMLERMGATVVAVIDGLEAVDALSHNPNEFTQTESGKSEETSSSDKNQNSPPYDLILMDCQMPKMDGYEATREIRRRECGKEQQHIPIVALTAHAMPSDEAKCLEVGMDAYLTKPIDCKQMASTILQLTRPSLP